MRGAPSAEHLRGGAEERGALSSPFPTLLAAELAGQGPMPFRDFMAEALYAPKHGLYTRRDARIGADRETGSATFVKQLASGVATAYAAFAGRHAARIVEQGPGSGQLMRQVLAHLPRELRVATRVEFIEPLLARRTRLLAILDEFGVQGSVLGSPRNLDAGPAFVLAKELVSSFPVHWLERTTDGWAEVNVTFASDAWRWEETLDTAPPMLARFVEENAPHLPVGHRYEADLQVPRWLGELTAPLAPCTLVVMDRPVPDPRPRAGTIEARLEGKPVPPYAAPGHADLSAAVDFDALARAAGKLGLRSTAGLLHEDLGTPALRTLALATTRA